MAHKAHAATERSCGRVHRLPVVGTVLAVVALASVAHANPEFIAIGSLPGDNTRTDAGAISADGLVVTGIDQSTSVGHRGFRWTAATGIQDIGFMPGGASANPQGINADGSVIVGWGSSSSGIRAFRWTAATGCVNLGVVVAGGYSQATAVSGDGAMVVGVGTQSFHWRQSTGMQDLGGWVALSPQGVNFDGSVVVGSSGGVPMRWTVGSGGQDMGFLSGGNYATARAVNSNASIIAGWSNSFQVFQYIDIACRWTQPTPGGAWVAEPLGDGLDVSYALAISPEGSVIVGRRGISNAAFMWRADLGMVILRDYLVSLGVGSALDGWTLTSATGVSANGRAITGTGTFNGRPSAWIVRGLPVAGGSSCPADFDQSGGPAPLSVQDIFDFLNAWFALDPRADFNATGGISAQDIFDFLGAWFAGCP